MIDPKNFTGPNPPEWRNGVSVAYFKDKLYYLGGYDDPKTMKDTNRVDVRRSMQVHEIIYSGFNRWKMANRTCFSSFNYGCSNNNMR